MRQLLILILLASPACQEVLFTEAQPKGIKPLKQVPEELLGSYTLDDDNDTLIVTSKGFYPKSEPKDVLLLNDSLVMKSYKGYYFVSQNQNPWAIRIIKKEKNGDLSLLSLEYSADIESFVDKLSKEVKVNRIEWKGETHYQIDPSPKELVHLIRKGYFEKRVLKKQK